MSHQRSIVHHFLPLNVQDLEKNFSGKIVQLVKTNTKLLLKHQFCSHNIYMSHQRSIVHHFFLLTYKT